MYLCIACIFFFVRVRISIASYEVLCIMKDVFNILNTDIVVLKIERKNFIVFNIL